jgi:dUTP pyrophosphatase
MSLNLKVKQLPNFIDLKQREFGNAGFDLYAAEAGIIMPHGQQIISVGIATSFSPEYYMRIAPRSGLAAKNGIDVLAGVIDSSYRGEWKVILRNNSNTSFSYRVGDRIAQAIPEKISTEDFIFVEELSDSIRAERGFGSTGV